MKQLKCSWSADFQLLFSGLIKNKYEEVKHVLTQPLHLNIVYLTLQAAFKAPLGNCYCDLLLYK